MAPRGVTGVLLAGGRSRRMGRDKRMVLVDGVPMIRRAVLALSAAVDDLVVVVAADDRADLRLADLAVRYARDRLADAGPLAGLEAGLSAARHDIVLVAAADMPWVSPEMLGDLAGRLARASDATDAVLVASERGVEPMPAAVRRRTRPTVSGLLDDGERRLGALTAALSTVVVTPEDWRRLDRSGRSLHNVNEPSDLVRSA